MFEQLDLVETFDMDFANPVRHDVLEFFTPFTRSGKDNLFRRHTRPSSKVVFSSRCDLATRTLVHENADYPRMGIGLHRIIDLDRFRQSVLEPAELAQQSTLIVHIKRSAEGSGYLLDCDPLQLRLTATPFEQRSH